MPLTILAVADQISDSLYEHFERERWRHVELILSCGDLPPEYLDFLGSWLNVPVFYVRGNHDGKYHQSRFYGLEDVHGRIVTWKGVRIVGFEGSRRYNRGACQYSEAQMHWAVRRARLQALRSGKPDVILAHAPPAGVHDGWDLAHRGFQAFNPAINMWKPSHFLHGHMHAYNFAEQCTIVGQTAVLNAFPYRLIEVALPNEGVRKPTSSARR